MANRRIFYACNAVGIGNKDGNSIQPVRGAQTVGINTTFNLEQVFEIGMLGIYENIENLPNVEVTLEKVLDGHPLIYKLATATAASNKLIDAAYAECSAILTILDDTVEAATGTPLATVKVTGAVISQVSYAINVEGNGTEQVTLVSNNKTWSSLWTPTFSPTGVPASASGVVRRQHFDKGGSTFPTSIPGGAGAVYQSIRTSANITREDIFELGSKKPYFKYAKFPVEVTTEFEIIAKTGDQISVIADAKNLTDETIILAFIDGPTIDLGTKNKLQSANYQGGGTDGSNATITYSYQTFNNFTVTP